MARTLGAGRGAGKLTARQSQIVDVAMRIIATQGGRRFTVQRLARAVGVTGGAIYRHFASMEALVDAIVDRVGEILFRGFPPKADGPIERLGLFFRQRTAAIRAHPHVSRLLLSDHLAQASGAAHAARLEGFKRRSQRFVRECLQEAAGSGELANEVAPEVGAVIVLGAIHALSHCGAPVVSERHAAMRTAEVWVALEQFLRGGERRAGGEWRAGGEGRGGGADAGTTRLRPSPRGLKPGKPRGGERCR